MMKGSFFNDATSNLTLDYHSVLQSISEFRRSNGSTSQLRFDGPQTYYFKLFFYFDENISEANSKYGIPKSNLLGLTYDGTTFTGLPWEGGQVKSNETMSREENGYVPVNTALNYLLLNYEWDRARKLTEFIKLLSEISSKCPWYFKTISGLDKAIERKEVTDKEFKLEEERKSFQIKCLPDSEDNKIGRLLDLYRNIVYSQLMHKEILPANLRKFDMGIFIFSRPLKNMHRKVTKPDLTTKTGTKNWDKPTPFTGDYASFDPFTVGSSRNNTYKTSYKYIEFHNCEIDYNSSASAYTDFDNGDGFKQEYTINIFYDDALEDRYDEWTMRRIGDFSVWDLNLNENMDQENEFWQAFFDQEQTESAVQGIERSDREKLYTSKGNTIETLDSKIERNLSDTSLGVTANDHIRNGAHDVGSLWQGKLVQQNGGIFTNMVNQATGYVKRNYIDPKVKELRKLVLGNFYTVQFKNTIGSIKDISKGNLLGAIDKTKKVVKGWKQKS